MIYRQAEWSDAAELAAFAERVFVASFEGQLARAELAFIAQQRFTLEREQSAIADPASTMFLACNPEMTGYAHVIIGNRPVCALSAAAPAELKRIYVDEPWHGRGVAQQLMNLVEKRARIHSCDVLWLSVWDGNQRAIAFYQKCGFAPVGSSELTVGNLSLVHNVIAKPLRDLP